MKNKTALFHVELFRAFALLLALFGVCAWGCGFGSDEYMKENKKSVENPATGKPGVSSGKVTIKGKPDCKACGGSGLNSKGEPCVCVPSLVSVEYQSKLQAVNQDMVYKLGEDIVRATGDLAGKYLTLCLYIREHKLGPKEVSVPLAKLGFKRSRISEINKVAGASDALFENYQGKLLGFNKVLNMARMESPTALPTATPAARLLTEGGQLSSDEADKLIKEEVTPSDAKGFSTTKTQDGLRKAAHYLASRSTRNKVWVFKDASFKVTVEKLPKTQPAVGDDKRG